MKPINLKLGTERTTEGGASIAPSALALKVSAALEAVNGKATAHAFTDMHDINALIVQAEKELDALCVPKSARKGAMATAVSGDPVASAYKYKRAATRVKIERSSSGWSLTDIQSDEIYKDGGGFALWLTPEQDAQAVANLRKRYKIKASA